MAFTENPKNAYIQANRMIQGELVKDVAGSANHVLDAVEQEYACIIFTGALTGNIDVVVDAAPNGWQMQNATTGAFTLTVKKSGGTGVAITQGKKVDLRYSTHAGDVVAFGPEV